MNDQEKKFLSIKESSLLTGKSESTLKRFVQKNFSSGKSKGIPKNNQKIKKEKAPKGFFWFIEESFLLENFPAENSAPHSSSENSEIVQILKEQLEKKDEQISQLLDRQRESNILTKNLQDKILALEPGEKKSGQSVVDQEEIIPTKKSFWEKIFKK
jgi:hypothetical protein